MAEKTSDERLRDLETCLLLVYLETARKPFGSLHQSQRDYFYTALDAGKHVRLVPHQPNAPCSEELFLNFEVEE